MDEVLTKAAEAVNKKFKSSPTERGSTALALPDQWVSSGSLSFDRLCTGYNPGGLPVGPYGRVVHIPGERSMGKSLILDHFFKSVQDMGGIAIVSETEGSRDTHFALAIGLNLETLVVQRPKTIEELVDMGMEFIASVRSTKEGKKIPIVWGLDSLDSTQAEKASEKGLTESGGWHFGGGRSEALGAGLRKIVQETARNPTTFIMLNQTRDNVGVMFGPKKTTPGGNAPLFYNSLEVWLSPSPLGMVTAKSQGTPLRPDMAKRLGLDRGGESIKIKGETFIVPKGNVVGRWVRAKIHKTKVAQTLMQEADFYVSFTKGVHRWGGLLQSMLREGQVEVMPDNSVKHKSHVTGEIAEFPSAAEWYTWLDQNPDMLAARKGLAAPEDVT